MFNLALCISVDWYCYVCDYVSVYVVCPCVMFVFVYVYVYCMYACKCLCYAVCVLLYLDYCVAMFCLDVYDMT